MYKGRPPIFGLFWPPSPHVHFSSTLTLTPLKKDILLDLPPPLPMIPFWAEVFHWHVISDSFSWAWKFEDIFLFHYLHCSARPQLQFDFKWDEIDFRHNYILEGPEKWTSIPPEPLSPISIRPAHFFFGGEMPQTSRGFLGQKVSAY